MGSDLMWREWDYRKELERLTAKLNDQHATIARLEAERDAARQALTDAERERDEARAFLRRTAMTGGSIVSSAAMTAQQIAIVRAADRALAAVGRRLRLHRESLGWSQTFAATKAKVHPKHMGVIENGKANVTLTSIVALARAYGVTLSELFDGVK